MRKVKGPEAPHESTTSGNATLPLQVKVGVAHSQGAEGSLVPADQSNGVFHWTAPRSGEADVLHQCVKKKGAQVNSTTCCKRSVPLCPLSDCMLTFNPRHTCQVCVSADAQQAAALLIRSQHDSSHSCSTSGRAEPQRVNEQRLHPDTCERARRTNTPAEPQNRK